jgi:hypothetical protein
MTRLQDQERWRWGKSLIACFDDLRAEFSAMEPPILDREVIPDLAGSPNGLVLWLICAKSADVPRMSSQSDALRHLVTDAIARRGFAAEARDSLRLLFTSHEEIEAGGGRFYYFR